MHALILFIFLTSRFENSLHSSLGFIIALLLSILEKLSVNKLVSNEIPLSAKRVGASNGYV